jgi:hypothetical protein
MIYTQQVFTTTDNAGTSQNETRIIAENPANSKVYLFDENGTFLFSVHKMAVLPWGLKDTPATNEQIERIKYRFD